eukprot:12588736-Alexandrium_andersonii.AAC.1
MSASLVGSEMCIRDRDPRAKLLDESSAASVLRSTAGGGHLAALSRSSGSEGLPRARAHQAGAALCGLRGRLNP